MKSGLPLGPSGHSGEPDFVDCVGSVDFVDNGGGRSPRRGDPTSTAHCRPLAERAEAMRRGAAPRPRDRIPLLSAEHSPACKRYGSWLLWIAGDFPASQAGSLCPQGIVTPRDHPWGHGLPARVRPESGGSCPEWRPFDEIDTIWGPYNNSSTQRRDSEAR